MEGFHATVFAYGQTGSGKTFTMEGYEYQEAKKLNNPDNREVVETFSGVQLRSKDHGFDSWSTLYTPVGYILKADNILSHLRDKLCSRAHKDPDNVTILENHTVTHVNRFSNQGHKNNNILLQRFKNSSGERYCRRFN